MKKYLNPEIEIVALANEDILTTSPGTETPWYEENDGSWEISAKAQELNAKCKMQNAKCKMQNAKCKVQNLK